MAFVEMNPRYRDVLERLGLTGAGDFLSLPAVLVSGHPDRNVGEVTLGDIPAYLKREHQVGWRTRLGSAWAGFGPVSRSLREAHVLRDLEATNVPCPEWIAAGEDDEGRAFLMVRALTDSVELRTALQHQRAGRFTPDDAIATINAAALGEALARLHDAGFDQPDLFSKHVFVDRRDGTIRVLDWQRSRRHARLGWQHRSRDLACLHATLADDLAGPRERLRCLRAYLRATTCARPPSLRSLWAMIERHSARLLRRRYIREMRRPSLAFGTQRLIWLDGEALCVTPEFRTEQPGRMPEELILRRFPDSLRGVSETMLVLPGRPILRRRQETRFWGCLWSWLRGNRLTSPEFHQASLLFRLQRHGIPAPRLLAFGERRSCGFRLQSFLLMEPIAGAVPLACHRPDRIRILSHNADPRLAAKLLTRLHEAGCYLADDSPRCALALFSVQPDTNGLPSVVLNDVAGLQLLRRPCPRRARRDLEALEAAFPFRQVPEHATVLPVLCPSSAGR